jgi:capsular polysaccharide biosynthesis protein
MEQEMKILINDSRNIFKIWKKSIWLVLVMSIIGFILGCVITLYPNADEYYANTTVYSYSIYGDGLKAISQLVKTSRICEKAAVLINDEAITGDRIKNMISVEYATDSMILSINAISQSSEEAIMVANSVANVLVNEINNQKGNYTLNILDKASSASIYSRGIVQQWLVRIALSIVFFVATLVVLAIKCLIARNIVVTEDFTCGGQLELLGVIPRYYMN